LHGKISSQYARWGWGIEMEAHPGAGDGEFAVFPYDAYPREDRAAANAAR
jgi:hypothetical protein